MSDNEAETRANRVDVELARAGWSSIRRNLVEEYVLRTGEPSAWQTELDLSAPAPVTA